HVQPIRGLGADNVIGMATMRHSATNESRGWCVTALFGGAAALDAVLWGTIARYHDEVHVHGG
ncbi:MAG TPA: hypothetical protein VFC40_00715, partial [Syntrophomonas sp.]|nr:hypothetical protein [Syntrophomonas sp.]